MEIIKFTIYNLGLALFDCFLFSLLIVLGINCKKSIWKHISYNFSAIFIALFIFELYSFYTQDDEEKVVFSGTYADNKMVSGRKDLVGYGPRDDISFNASAIRTNGDSVIYNVIYSFHNGRRVVPNNNDSAKKNVFFLGCSYVFGDGLNDNQTLPYYFSKYSKGSYTVFNYAFSGYGGHQALKIVEEKITKSNSFKLSDKDCVVYYFIPSHIERAAGYAIWDVYGPRYEVENNKLICKGDFEEFRFIKHNYFTKRFEIIWKNSALYKSFFQPKVCQKDAIRMIEIVKKMDNLLKSHGTRFIIVVGLSVHKNKQEELFYESLISNNIEHYFVDSIIIDMNVHFQDYTIKGDGHPNEKHNLKIGEFLSKKLQ